MANYLEQLEKGQNDYLFEAKTFIGGREETGKTTLAKAPAIKILKSICPRSPRTELIFHSGYFQRKNQYTQRFSIQRLGFRRARDLPRHASVLTRRSLYLLSPKPEKTYAMMIFISG